MAAIGHRAAEYDIRCLADFVKIPPDRLCACLTDFVTWLALVRRADDTEEIAKGLLGEGAVTLARDHFTWVDDGRIGEVSAFNITLKDTGEPIGRIELGPASNRDQQK
jgi:hypothetical protein